MIAAGADPMALSRGIHKAVEAVSKAVLAMATKIEIRATTINSSINVKPGADPARRKRCFFMRCSGSRGRR
jgi:chaperonin GroEL (HSP60 family)